MISFHSFSQGQKRSTDSDTANVIPFLQQLNKPLTSLRAEKNYNVSIQQFHHKLETHKSSLISELQTLLGYTPANAEHEWAACSHLLQNMPVVFHPQTHYPRGLVAIALPWSSPLFRFCHQALTALIQQNTVLLVTTEESSVLYCRLAEWIYETDLGAERIAVISTKNKDVVDMVCEHPSVKALHVEAPLHAMTQWRERVLSPHRLYRFFSGAHNPVIIFNDVDLNRLSEALISSLQYHENAEVRFNRWFVQEKIYPQFLEWLQAHIPKDTFGHRPPGLYSHLLDKQIHELKKIKHWLLPWNAEEKDINICTDFSNCSPIHQEELLGPLLTMTRFNNSQEVAKFANTTFFTNASCVYTSSAEKFKEMCTLLRAPHIFLNSIPDVYDPRLFSGEFLCGAGLEQTNENFYAGKKSTK